MSSPKPVDVGQIDTAPLTRKLFPAGRPYRIFMSPQAYETTVRHAQESLAGQGGLIHEVGGVLVGDVFRDEEGPFLDVVAAIVAEHTRSDGTQLVFTHETWDQINRTKDAKYPDARIVGWYHTHPRFGVFLSDYDVFIQRHHFGEPWATAFVLDPIRETEGFFIWSGGEPRLAAEYWIGHERRDRSFAGDRQPLADVPHAAAASAPGPASAVSRASFALATVVGFLSLLFLFGYVYSREVGHTETEKFVLRAVEAQRAELEATYQALHSLRAELETSVQHVNTNAAQMRARIQQVDGGLRRLASMTTALQTTMVAQQQAIAQIQLTAPIAAPEPPSRPASKSEVQDRP